jgi:predicted component of type VI protein secretion system
MPYVLRDAYGHDYPVTGTITIGRDPGHGIVLADSVASRFHATVWDQAGILYIRDENSSNGTFVNQVRIQQSPLRMGDQIRIGDTIFTVNAPVPSGPPPGAQLYRAPAASPGPPQPATQLYGQAPVPPPVGQYAAPAAPPVAQYAAPAAPPRRGPGCWVWLIGGCLVLIVGCLVVAGGGFFAYQSGMITQNTVLNVVGLGPADMEFDNFRDEPIHMTIVSLDVTPSPSAEPGSFDVNANASSLELGSFDIYNWHVPQPGHYRVDFSLTSGGDELGTCTLNLKSGDQYQFVALPERIVVNRANHPSDNGPDFVVETSSLCR